MCISSRIKKYLAEKEALDARIAKLEQLEIKTAPVKNLLTELLSGYTEESPEDLASVWDEILAIGAKFNLSVESLAAEELQQWETANVVIERLRSEDRETKRQYLELTEVSANRVRELQAELEKEKDNYQTLVVINKVFNQQLEKAYAEVEVLRSQLAQMQVTPESECEPENAMTTVESILKANGFFQFDADMPPDWDASELYENYRGWDIFCSIPNGGIVAIGLNNSESNQFWDASTEYIQEIEGNSFPESLGDYDAIVAWTRALIDRVENLQAPGQLALEFPSPEEENIAVDEELALTELQKLQPVTPEADRYRNFNQIFKLQDFKVDVRQHNEGKEFAGASFNFYQADKLIYSQSLTAAECGNKHPKELATEIIEGYWQKLREKKEREANPYAKEEDKFVELVKISNCVGYLKRRDTGEILSAYAAFAMKNEEGEKLDTFAKPRATKWAEYFRANNEASEEGKIAQLVVSDPRKSKRLVSDNPKMPFSYEIKFTGVDRSYLDRLAQIDLSVSPGEQKIKKPSTAKLPVEVAPTYQVMTNGYQLASGTEQEMRSRFEEELRTFGDEGRSVMSLVCGNEIIEGYLLSEFVFVPAQDFDEENPEYFVVHTPTKTNFRVYRSLASGSSWINSIYPYRPNLFSTKEAAAVDAVRRSFKAESAE